MIHLKQPGSSCLVDENVEAKNLKAHVVVDVTGLRSSVVMDEIRLHRYQSLDDHVSHLSFYLFNVETVLRKLDPDAVEASFVASSGFSTFISYIICVILINCIISQMNKRIVKSFLFILLA